MDVWTGSTRFAGRKYIVSPLLVKPRRVKAKGKEYVQHIIYIPRSIAKTLYSHARIPLREELPVITMIAPTAWYHVLNWKEEPVHAFNQLPQDIKLELEALGLAPKHEYIPLTILAKPQEIKELGLDPGKPVTLREFKKKIIEKTVKPTIVKSLSQPK